MRHPMNTTSQLAAEAAGCRMPVTTKLEAAAMLSDVLRSAPISWVLNAKSPELRRTVKAAVRIAVNEYHLPPSCLSDDPEIRAALEAVDRLVLVNGGTDPRMGTFRSQAAYALLRAHEQRAEVMAAALRETAADAA